MARPSGESVDDRRKGESGRFAEAKRDWQSRNPLATKELYEAWEAWFIAESRAVSNDVNPFAQSKATQEEANKAMQNYYRVKYGDSWKMFVDVSRIGE